MPASGSPRSRSARAAPRGGGAESSGPFEEIGGTLIYDNVGTAGNLPMAAAIALVPICIILVFLLLVRRTGALKSL